MQRNRCFLDANAILRFLLQDNEEQFQYVRDVIKTENCYVTLLERVVAMATINIELEPY